MDMNASSLCQDCGLVFTEKWMLKEHKRVAHDERVIKCDYCNMQIIGLMKMRAHKQKHKHKLQCLNKNGEGPGGKFNGPSLKTVLDKIEELDKIVQTKGYKIPAKR